MKYLFDTSLFHYMCTVQQSPHSVPCRVLVFSVLMGKFSKNETLISLHVVHSRYATIISGIAWGDYVGTAVLGLLSSMTY